MGRGGRGGAAATAWLSAAVQRASAGARQHGRGARSGATEAGRVVGRHDGGQPRGTAGACVKTGGERGKRGGERERDRERGRAQEREEKGARGERRERREREREREGTREGGQEREERGERGEGGRGRGRDAPGGLQLCMHMHAQLTADAVCWLWRAGTERSARGAGHARAAGAPDRASGPDRGAGRQPKACARACAHAGGRLLPTHAHRVEPPEPRQPDRGSS
jgi:hypothetical protein